MGIPVSFTYHIGEIEMDVTASVNPEVRAVTHLAPEDCYPAEGGEVEDLQVKVGDQFFDTDDLYVHSSGAIKSDFDVFHNRLRIFLNLEYMDLTMLENDEEVSTFRTNPWRWFIQTDDTKARAMWSLVTKREGRQAKYESLSDVLEEAAYEEMANGGPEE